MRKPFRPSSQQRQESLKFPPHWPCCRVCPIKLGRKLQWIFTWPTYAPKVMQRVRSPIETNLPSYLGAFVSRSILKTVACNHIKNRIWTYNISPSFNNQWRAQSMWPLQQRKLIYLFLTPKIIGIIPRCNFLKRPASILAVLHVAGRCDHDIPDASERGRER